MGISVTGEEVVAVPDAERNVHRFAKADFFGIFHGNFPEILPGGHIRDHVFALVDVADVVHMPVDIGVAVGYGKGALLRSRDASEAGGERNLIARYHTGHINALLLWEDEGAGLGVDQRPEGAAGEKQSTVGREHPVVAGKENMHCLSRPGFKNDGFVIFRQAADLGSVEALWYLGTFYEDGSTVRRNYEKALEYYRQAAEKGDADSLMSIAYCYVNGRGVERDPDLAMTYYQKAAEAGSALACDYLGYLYLSGESIPKARFSCSTAQSSRAMRNRLSTMTKSTRRWLKLSRTALS